MTREQTIKLLQMMRAAYPNTKIADPKGTVDAWLLAFGEDDASVIYKAARHHMNTSPYFPTPSDIRKSTLRGQMLYTHAETASDAPKIASKSTDDVIVKDNSFCDLCGLCDIRDQSKCEF